MKETSFKSGVKGRGVIDGESERGDRDEVILFSYTYGS